MIYFIIPARNEERNLPLLVSNTRSAMLIIKHPYEIVIVNDGSTDGTSELCRKFAKELPLLEISLGSNIGVDEAFKAGFRYVLGKVKKGDVIITKEADNTSDPSILARMVDLVRQGSDLVLASCFAKEGGVENSSLDRHILSFGANLLIKMFFPLRGIHTYSSFYRAYNALTIKRIWEAYEGKLIEERGFVCMVEMLVKIARLSVNITEVPMTLRCDKREGVSKMRRSKTIAGYVKFISRQLMRSRALDKYVKERFAALVKNNEE